MPPYSPHSQCSQPGCPATVRRGYCAKHTRARDADDRDARGTSTQRGYGARHRKWRKLVLHNDPKCVTCLAKHPEVVRPSIVADHIVPLDPKHPLDGDWSIENGQGLCHTCHSVKTAKERD